MFPKVFLTLALLGLSMSRAVPTSTAEAAGSTAIPGSYKYNASTPTANDPSPAELAWLESLNWDGTIIPFDALGTAYLDEPGAPLASSAGAKAKRDESKGIYVCTDVNWGGQCGYASQPTNECISLGNPWWKAVSSWGPDAGQKCYGYATNYCKWWEPDGCDANDCWMYGGNPSIGPVRQPGIDTVEGWQDGSVNWNDQMASWICYVE